MQFVDLLRIIEPTKGTSFLVSKRVKMTTVLPGMTLYNLLPDDPQVVSVGYDFKEEITVAMLETDHEAEEVFMDDLTSSKYKGWKIAKDPSQ